MYNTGSSVNAKYVHERPYGSSRGDLRVYIPSLMPLIAMSTPKITPVSLNRACFANASECKPDVSSQINTQNYVTAKAYYNQYEYSCYWFGSDLSVSPREEDFLSCILRVEEADNSTPWPIY